MSKVKIWRGSQNDEVFVRMNKRGYVFLCGAQGEAVGGAPYLVHEDGERSLAVCPTTAKDAGVILDEYGRWDADQCIQTLHRMLREVV